MGGFGGGAQGSSSRSSGSTAISPFQKPYFKKLYQAGVSDILNDPLSFYPGQSVASQDPATLGYYNNALGYAQSGSPALNQAGGYNADVLSGQYLSPESNPYLRSTYDQAARAVTDNYRDAVLPAIQSRFAGAGQSLSGQYLGARGRADQALGTSLADLGTSIYGGAYNAERGRQEAARNFAPVLAADQMDRLGLQQSIGEQRQGYQQSLLDDLISRFEFGQDEPYLRLSRYAGLLGNPLTVSRQSGRSGSFGFQLGGLG